jgi:hypothetical protein
VSQEILGQVIEHWRHVAEVSNACSDDNSSCLKSFATFSSKLEAFVHTVHGGNIGLFQFGYEAFLKLQTVGDERLNGHWISDICVWETLFMTIVSQGKR